jgi:hypothetical protein
MKDKRHNLPPSREVRLTDGITQGEVEQIAWSIYTGDAGTLGRSIERLELVVELKRSKAVEGFKKLLRRKLEADGYIVVSDLDHIAEVWHERELTDGDADNIVYLEDFRPEDLTPDAA